ncbi:putative nucleic acid-binding Zn-ribbon protein [Virgibacillus natechei]|uniref:Nucleic acid-binding Zn-ribbon protein n=1 Tax=Virgibacillus natechei TaxID=1216297 RepID=A0ABS4IID3_9BACI|nr:hypothetical protein [Virgibacillus natechei]MBP1970681.1 putative nucleic acid-binding Zn-ribbon protein [Virgibacillus natechei]UZD12073.1 hypothetical protein OLD84_14160 [Virgibacillus natechei]
MKRIAIVLLISSFFVSGCMNQASASVVEDIYRAAQTGDEDYIRTVFDENYESIDENLEEVMEQLASEVSEMYGATNMSLKELRQRELQTEVIQTLDKRYEENWYLVVGRLDDDHVILWTLQSDGYYFVADREKLSNDAYHKTVLD